MIAICIVLIIITIICVALFLMLYEDIRKLNEQIDYKNESGSHFEVFTQSDIPSIKELQKKINNLYQDNSKIEEKAFRKEKEMQTLMSGISHDIRTPLTSMQGYLKLIRETNDEIERHKYLEIIDFRLESLKSILEDLFIHSKLSDEEYHVEMKNFEIYPLICKILASFYYDFEKKKIVPIITFSNEHLIIHSNKELMTRMIQNLINNALKHGDSYFEIKEENGSIYFINGVMNAAKIEADRLFDRFYKADDSRHNSSTGLGLSIVKKIVEIHNWNIEAIIKENKLEIKISIYS